MEKTICRLSFWLGIATLVIALIWRGLDAVGIRVPAPASAGHTVYYMSFYKASLLFFVTTIATQAYMSTGSNQ